jgi:DNA-binding MarR family transcriptional regulator
MAKAKKATELKTYEAALILSRANRRLNDFLRKELQKFDLSIPEWEYLGLLRGSHTMRVQAFANLLDVETPFATRLGHQLVEKKLITIETDPGDKRVRLVTTTQKGYTLLDTVEIDLRRAMRAYLKPIDRTELDVYLGVTAQVAELDTTV